MIVDWELEHRANTKNYRTHPVLVKRGEDAADALSQRDGWVGDRGIEVKRALEAFVAQIAEMDAYIWKLKDEISGPHSNT